MKRYVSLLVLLLVWCFAGPGPWSVARAAPLQPDEVPAPLREWISWVQHDEPETTCPFVTASNHAADGPRRCLWPARLELALDDAGGRFTHTWRLYRRSWVPLPGDAKRWPQDVTVSSAPAIVVGQGGRPGLELPAGTHEITGRFTWDSLPERLEVPPETGLLTLTLAGELQPYPQRDAGGALWLNRRALEGAEEDLLDIVVNRKIQDAIPVVVTTRIELHAAGKNREELLARAALDGFVPMSVTSDLPARIEPDGRLRVQVRPGRWIISIDARHDGPVAMLTLPNVQGPWASEEIWAYESFPDLHEVDVSGAATIDPQQTLLPDEWKRFPAYRLTRGDTLTLTERRRGEIDRGPDRLTLNREWWLDFDGHKLTVRDHISGQVHNAWRLDMNPTGELGRVTVAGKDQPITYRDNGLHRGVELRQRNLDLTADLRVQGDEGDGVIRFSAVNWDHDFHEVDGLLHLPPGWRLLHATGVDEVGQTWVQGWSLLDIFLALVISIAIGRLFGVGWGLLSLITLGLCFPEWMSPKVVFLFALVGEALRRVLPEGRLRKVVEIYRAIVLIILAIVAIAFCVHQVRAGISPALDRSDDVGLFRFGGADNVQAQVVSKDVNAPSPTAAQPPPPPPEEEMAGEIADAAAAFDPMQPEGGDGDDRSEDIDALLENQRSSFSEVEKSAGKMDFKGVRVSQQVLARKRQQLREYDANTVVQTGPGVPTWRWRTVRLDWSGPVEREHEVVLYLLRPLLNRIAAGFRVLLMVILVLAVFGVFRPRRRASAPGPSGSSSGSAAATAALALVVLAGVTAAPGVARADDYPSQQLLDQLAERMAEKPTCLPECVTSPRMQLEASPEGLRVRLEVHAAAHVAVPLPGAAAHWLPSTIVVDASVLARGAARGPASPAEGAPQPAPGDITPGSPPKPRPLAAGAFQALARDASGTLWLDLEPGRHQIILDGPLPARETVQLALPLKPHHVSARVDGWTIEGIHEDGLADDNLQLTRVHKEGEAPQTLEMGPLPPFVIVERVLQLGLSWELTTRVVRSTPPGAAVVVSVPLLPGESVTSERMRVDDGKVLVNIAPDEVVAEWSSALEVTDSIELKAAVGQPWVESWKLEVGPLWHLETDGIPIVSQGDEGLRQWRPWPAEVVTLTISRPQGVDGQTKTIDGAHLLLSPGLRATDATLTLNFRSSRGGHHTIELPPLARLQAVRIDGVDKAIGQEDRLVRLPLVPGHQTIQLDWREPMELGSLYHAPEVALGAAEVGVHVGVVNATVEINFPRDRWVLWVEGPRLGPTVLFWAFLVTMLIVAFLLARVKWVPLRTHQWFLLAAGLSTVPVAAAAFVALWLLALGWRQRAAQRPLHPGLFNLMQLGLIGLTLIAGGVLVVAVMDGLLTLPDMQIEGNGSYRNDLIWYQDRVDGLEMPRPGVYSVVLLWWYRGAMLLWALWLAWSLVRWMPWAWRCVSAGGLWRKMDFGGPPRGPGSGGPAGGPTEGGGPGGASGSSTGSSASRRLRPPLRPTNPGEILRVTAPVRVAPASRSAAPESRQAQTSAAPQASAPAPAPAQANASAPAPAPAQANASAPAQAATSAAQVQPEDSSARGSWHTPSSLAYSEGGARIGDATTGVTNSGSFAIANAAKVAMANTGAAVNDADNATQPRKKRILSSGPSISGNVRVTASSSGAGLELEPPAEVTRRVFEPRPLLPIPDSVPAPTPAPATPLVRRRHSSGSIVVPKLDESGVRAKGPLPPPVPPPVIPPLTQKKPRK